MTTLATLATQLLQGLAFLHNLSIVHCDLKPENVCLVSASRRRFKIIIDFGSAVLTHDCHNFHVQSRQVARRRSCWACRTRRSTSGSWPHRGRAAPRPAHFHGGSVELVLAAQEETLGRHPQHMVDASETAKMYYAPDGRLFTVDPQERRPERTCCSRGPSLQRSSGSADEGFLDFLTTILSLDPDRRPTAQEAARHPWLASTSADSSGVSAADGEGTGAPPGFATQLYGGTSPNMSRSSSEAGSDTSSPVSSRAPFAAASPVSGGGTHHVACAGPRPPRKAARLPPPSARRRRGARGAEAPCVRGPGRAC